ncbi:SF1B family DNA helicase RecD2 [Helicovermis profundi]|uniref:ATP-dependent RecD2 DNA helicase n=1 Tax=Helicovermis profundi TaxID=3065157 RepID=A0AAU9ES39_9FIRM|nr:ATP-dependent RecD-like DNA helicase [Clostridia bacterium S502]
MPIEIKGIIEEIIYKNEENGFVVAIIDKDALGSEYIYIKGIIPIINEGEMMKIVGREVVHPSYGEQIDVISSEIISPKTSDEVLRYLSSGVVKGIGPSFAKKIVDKFGQDTFDIMKYNPERLKEIPGIGEKKINDITSSFSMQAAFRDIMIYLQKIGLSNTMATKIFKAFGENTIEFISENPYMLADEIAGIGFRQADMIAKKMGISEESIYRMHTGIKYALNTFIRNGHTFAFEEDLIEKSFSILYVDRELIKVEIKELVIKGELYFDKYNDKTVIYFPIYYHSEVKVCQKLFSLSSSDFKEVKIDVKNEIKNIESQNDISFDDKQIDAITKAVKGGVTVITGGPGTGKTTIINTIIKVFESVMFSVKLAAPTGRAAKKMTEATSREAKTIHRLLEYTYSNEKSDVIGFNKNEENPLTADVIIIDEMSMVDILLMNSLLNAVPEGTRLILVGDSDQLPSVGAGSVLKDIIEASIEFMDIIKLDRIFRQASESMIVTNAHRINKGNKPLLNEKDKDFFFINEREHKNIVGIIKNLCSSRLPNYYKLDKVLDIQVLTPMKKSMIGTKNINNELQKVLNPSSKLKKEKKFGDKLFREGDKIMQIKNNYTIKWKTILGSDGEGVFNGDIGFIEKIDEINKTVNILYDNEKIVKYEFTSLDEIMHAYAITVHKSQGSEFPVVVMPISYGAEVLMTRNVLYTAITRARKLVVLVGEEKYLNNMINNNSNINRNTGLKDKFTHITSMYKEILENQVD